MERCQLAIESCLHKLFSKWGRFAGTHPWKTILLSLVCLLVWSAGWVRNAEFDDPQLVWAPKGSQAVEDLEHSKDLFPSTSRFFNVLATAKSSSDGNLLTKAGFDELQRMDATVRNFEHEFEGKTYRFADLCVKGGAAQQC